MPNLNGDYMSDALAAQVGPGLGQLGPGAPKYSANRAWAPGSEGPPHWELGPPKNPKGTAKGKPGLVPGSGGRRKPWETPRGLGAKGPKNRYSTKRPLGGPAPSKGAQKHRDHY